MQGRVHSDVRIDFKYHEHRQNSRWKSVLIERSIIQKKKNLHKHFVSNLSHSVFDVCMCCVCVCGFVCVCASVFVCVCVCGV